MYVIARTYSQLLQPPLLYVISLKAGAFFLSVIADRKIGKSAAPSGAGGEGPQKQFFTAVKRRKQKPKCTGCMFQK